MQDQRRAGAIGQVKQDCANVDGQTIREIKTEHVSVDTNQVCSVQFKFVFG